MNDLNSRMTAESYALRVLVYLSEAEHETLALAAAIRQGAALFGRPARIADLIADAAKHAEDLKAALLPAHYSAEEIERRTADTEMQEGPGGTMRLVCLRPDRLDGDAAE